MTEKWWQEQQVPITKPLDNLAVAESKLSVEDFTKVRGLGRQFQEVLAAVAVNASSVDNPNKIEDAVTFQLLQDLVVRVSKHTLAVNGNLSKLKDVLQEAVSKL